MRQLIVLGLFVALFTGCTCGGGEELPDGGHEGHDGGGGGAADAGQRLAGDPQAIAVQNGKLIVAGSRSSQSGADFFVARYSTDGELDTSFGQSGYTTLDFDGGTFGGFITQNSDSVYAIAVGPDNAFVVAGGARGPGGVPAGGYALAKYTPDGELDPTFSMDGFAVTQIGPPGGMVATAFYAVVIQPDGKILAGGSLYNGTTNGNDYLLVRYNTDGTVDTSFADPAGGGGILKHYGGTAEHVRGLFLRGTKVIAAGGGRFLAVRYNADGTLDTTFGTSGIARHGTEGEAFAVASRPDGKLVLAGTTRVALPDGGTDEGLKVVQYTADGALDVSFGTGGVVESPVLIFVKGVVVEPNGNVAVYGTESFQPAVVRLLPDGTFDSSFGTGGVLVVDDYSLPILEQVFSGQQATYLNGQLWFADTGQGGPEQSVVNGDGVIVDKVPLP